MIVLRIIFQSCKMLAVLKSAVFLASDKPLNSWIYYFLLLLGLCSGEQLLWCSIHCATLIHFNSCVFSRVNLNPKLSETTWLWCYGGSKYMLYEGPLCLSNHNKIHFQQKNVLLLFFTHYTYMNLAYTYQTAVKFVPVLSWTHEYFNSDRIKGQWCVESNHFHPHLQ